MLPSSATEIFTAPCAPRRGARFWRPAPRAPWRPCQPWRVQAGRPRLPPPPPHPGGAPYRPTDSPRACAYLTVQAGRPQPPRCRGALLLGLSTARRPRPRRAAPAKRGGGRGRAPPHRAGGRPGRGSCMASHTMLLTRAACQAEPLHWGRPRAGKAFSAVRLPGLGKSLEARLASPAELARPQPGRLQRAWVRYLPGRAGPGQPAMRGLGLAGSGRLGLVVRTGLGRRGPSLSPGRAGRLKAIPAHHHASLLTQQ
jgi:hypothetical protein